MYYCVLCYLLVKQSKIRQYLYMHNYIYISFY